MATPRTQATLDKPRIHYTEYVRCPNRCDRGLVPTGTTGRILGRDLNGVTVRSSRQMPVFGLCSTCEGQGRVRR